MFDTTGKLTFSDTTLRDGEQAPGVVFSLADKLRIAAALDSLGVDEAEVGSAALGAEELGGLRVLAAQGFKMRLSCWCRALEEDIYYAAKAGIKTVNISFPVSDILLGSMDRCRDWVLHHLDSVLPFAAHTGCAFSVGLQDAGRADPAFLDRVVRVVEASGAFRLRVSDTVGILNPFTTAALISRVKVSAPKLDVSFHAHNDLSMAVANALAAAQAGADTLDCTVNGLGERAGNCPLEELLFALKYSAGLPLEWAPERLAALCALTSEASGRPVPLAKPVTGAMALRHESGIHVRSLLKDPLSYSAYPPSAVGLAGHGYALGKHSGAAGVKDFFATHGIRLPFEEVRRLTESVRQESRRLKRDLDEHEALELYTPAFEARYAQEEERGRNSSLDKAL
jgi:homocitrate synthase NifV